MGSTSAKRTMLQQSLNTLTRISATHEHILMKGRHQVRDDVVRFDWPATGFTLRVSGSPFVKVHWTGGHHHFNVAVDGVPHKIVVGGGSEEVVELASGLDPAQASTITVTKRTEATGGMITKVLSPVLFRSVLLAQGATTLAPPALHRPARRIVFIGDSDSAGFGVEGRKTKLHDFMSVQRKNWNADATWCADVARQFEAEMHLIAWSGIGLEFNAPGKGGPNMGAAFQRLVASDGKSAVTPAEADAAFSPHLVVLYIGGNDWWSFPTSPKKTAQFVAAYVAFLRRLLAQHPAAQMLILLADDKSCSCCDAAGQARFAKEMRAVLSDAVAQVGGSGATTRLHLGVTHPQPAINVAREEDWGTMLHWSAVAHKKWAAGVAPLVASVMGWEEKPRERRGEGKAEFVTVDAATGGGGGVLSASL